MPTATRSVRNSAPRVRHVPPAVAPVPGAPSSLVATAVSDTEANYTFTRADDTDTAVSVERAPDAGGTPGTYAVVATLPARSDVCADTSLWPSTTYWWRVRCANANGYGPYSAAVSATTQAATGGGAAPTGFTATAVDKETIDLAWTDTNAAGGGRQYWVEMSRDGGLTYLPVAYADSLTAHRYRPGRAGMNSAPLAPGTQYYFRVRCLFNSGDWGPFAAAANATTTAAAGVPAMPTGLDGGDPTDAQVVLTWDAHPDPAATFKVERVEANVFAAPIWNQTYAQIGTAGAGATGYTDNTAAAYKQYFYRVRATNGSGDSPYTAPVVVRTPHAVRGGGAQTKRVAADGTGDYLSISAAATWIDAMGPGDVLEIKGNGTTAYAERLMLTRRGRLAAPITVRGVADGSGNYPILSGTNATTSSTFSVGFTTYETYGLVFVGTHSTNTVPGPGHYVIEHLTLRNAKNAGTFTSYDGTTTRTWDFAASGVYVQKGDHVTIQNCTIHGNGNGVFTGDHGDLNIYSEDVTVRDSYLYDHGNSGSPTEHGLYLQGLRSTVEGCKVGPPLVGAQGNNLKDRGADTVVRFNKFTVAPAAHLLDLVENQDGYAIYHFLPGYRKAIVYGNSFASDATVSTLFHYGYDHANPQSGRKGVLYFYHNTLVVYGDTSYAPGISVFSTGYTAGKAWETVDARNNVLATLHAPGAGVALELDLLPVFGVASFGKNWVTTGWQPARSDQSFTGKAAGTGRFTTGADPLVVTVATDQTMDFRLQAGSGARGIAGALADVLPAALNEQYLEPAGRQARAATADAGAFEYGAA